MSNFFGKDARKEFKGYYDRFSELLDFCREIIDRHINDELFIKYKQISIQAPNEQIYDPYISTEYFRNDDHQLEDDIEYEKSFSYIQSPYKHSVLEHYLSWLDIPVYRTRIMMMYPNTCYNIHGDHSTRLHLPLFTNEQAFFLFVNKPIALFHLPADGKTTWVDTRKNHTFLNCSNQKRFHLVMVTGEY